MNGWLFGLLAAAQSCGALGGADFSRGSREAIEQGLLIDVWVEDAGVRLDTEPHWSEWGLGARSRGDRVGEVEVRADGSREVLRIDLPPGGADRLTISLGLLFGAGEPVAEEAELTAFFDRGRPLSTVLRGEAAARPIAKLDPDDAVGSKTMAVTAPPGRRVTAVELRPKDGAADPAFEGEDPSWGPDHAEFTVRSLSWTGVCPRQAAEAPGR